MSSFFIQQCCKITEIRNIILKLFQELFQALDLIYGGTPGYKTSIWEGSMRTEI